MERRLDETGLDRRPSHPGFWRSGAILWAGMVQCRSPNTAQTTQRILQNIAGPSWFQYCFSVYLRAAASTTVQILLSATGQESLTQVQVTLFVDQGYKSG